MLFSQDNSNQRDAAEAATDKHKEEWKLLLEVKDQLKERVKFLTAENERLKDSEKLSEEIQATIKKLEKQVEEFDEDNAAMVTERNVLKEKVNQLEVDLDVYKRGFSANEDAIDKESDKVTDWKKKYFEAVTENNRLKVEGTAKRKRIVDLETAVQKLESAPKVRRT